ncbi:MAG: cyclase family protein, partial [Pseudooceanicola sp.]
MRWKTRPEGANWGDFGMDDELGRMNLVTAEVRRAAAQEVREGLTFSLSLPITVGYPNPRRGGPELQLSERDGKPYMNFPLSQIDPSFTDVFSDDRISMYLQYSTHWDSLAHAGSMFDANGDGVEEAVFYNGWRGGKEIVGPIDYHGDGREVHREGPFGAFRMGIETLARKCIQTRGVLIDLHTHFGKEKRHVGYDDLMRVMEADGVEVGSGDILCLWTGYDELLLDPETSTNREVLDASCCGLDGRDRRLLDWIDASGVAGIVADNMGVEQQPASPAEGERYAMAP